jgi:uncharacterized membrane protein YGL010W
MLGNKTSEEWIAQYASSHQHPVNRLCHTLGIPLIAASLPLFVFAAFKPAWWPLPGGMFVVGWIFQFVGHAFEGKEPEFFHDWRFLLVGLRWWWAKMRGRA